MKHIFIRAMLALIFSSPLISNRLSAQSSACIITDLSKCQWEFRQTSSRLFLPATVPGSVHTDLLRNGLIGDPYYRDNENKLQWIGEQDWEYRTSFIATDKLLSYKNVEIEFLGLDTYAHVYINDSLVLETDNFFRNWKVDCKELLVPGANRLRILFISSVKINRQRNQSNSIPLADDYVYTRKPAYHYGWDWGPVFITQGIWKPVLLKYWNETRINDIQIIQESVTKKLARVKAVVEVEASEKMDGSLSVLYNSGKQKSSQNIHINKGIQSFEFIFEIKDPELWWTKQLGKQNLSYFDAVLSAGEKVIDSKSVRTGLRSIRLVQNPDSIGKTFFFELNGIPVFMKGANYIPQDLFLDRVTTADYKGVIKQASDANMNMLRVWGGGFYENDIFYDLCDENGILVWQDFMFACAMYPGDRQFMDNVREEAIYNIRRLRNHPSVALWCGNNENYIGWKDWKWSVRYNDADSAKVYNDYLMLYENLLPSVVKEFAPGSFYWPSSPKHGWGYAVNTDGDVHYWGIWHAQEPFEEFAKKENIGRFMSEYGFQGCPDFNSVKNFTLPEDWSISSPVMKLHQKHRIGYPVIDKYIKWYYQWPKDFRSYLYLSQVLQAKGIAYAIETHRRNMPHCMGTLYWQINDCYPVASWASVDYYDRWKALHYTARSSYSDILVSPFEEDGNINIYVISDNTVTRKADLILELTDFTGKILWKTKSILKIDPLTSRVYYTVPAATLRSLGDTTRMVLKSSVREKENTLSENLWYFCQPKDLRLDDPGIMVTTKFIEGSLQITLSSQSLAKNVFLWFENDEGSFSDNYFDLIPGFSRNILYKGKITESEAKAQLKIMTLKDSY